MPGQVVLRANSALELVGGTPVVRLGALSPEGGATVWAKLEAFNPLGCVKDRAAYGMLESAERAGQTTPGLTVLVEPSSGNLGIGLAQVCAVKRYRLIVVVPEGMAGEKVRLMRLLGAAVVLSPAERGAQGAIETARQIAEAHPHAISLNQFENLANAAIHEKTTGPEILADFAEQDLSAFVAGVGTGGTFTGTGRALRAERGDSVRLIAVEPAASAVLSGGKPGSHSISGIGVGFVPAVLDTQLIDEVISVADEEASAMVQRLARDEALCVGFSSGAAAVAAICVAQQLPRGSNVVAIFPDTGLKYLGSATSVGEVSDCYRWDGQQSLFTAAS